MSSEDDFELGAARKSPDARNLGPVEDDRQHAQTPPLNPALAGEVFVKNSPPDVPSTSADMANVGLDLAAAMSADENDPHHPVVLFGTANSGKTSLLLSLFSTLITQPKLETGLFLLPPLLGSSSPTGQKLHAEARHTFELKTQHFIDGDKIGKTILDSPFFIPVEFRPRNKPPVRFAFMESAGEWYRADKRDQTLFKPLRDGIETFISRYERGITFIYLIPYTQAFIDEEADQAKDSRDVSEAALAISGVLKTYNTIRVQRRDRDRHLMLVSKWDAHNRGNPDLVGADCVDRAELEGFCDRRHGQALAALRGLQLDKSQMALEAYCAGIIGKAGLLEPRYDYAVNLWRYLYKNALRDMDQVPASPFPEKAQPPAIWRMITTALDKITG